MGDDVFRAYASKTGKAEGNECAYCGARDTAEHTVFTRARWIATGEAIERKLGKQLATDNLIDIMLESKENWEEIHKVIGTIMKTKEVDEGRRQQRAH